MQNKKLMKTVMSAVFAAMICAATAVIHIPIPAVQGYVNLGDGVILLAAFFLGPWYGAAAAAIGSGLTDLFLGYAAYIPGTAAIKGLCAVIAGLILKRGYDKIKAAAVYASLAAELWMVAGYFIYESTALGYGLGALGSVPSNLAQGAVGMLIGCVLIHALDRIPTVRRFRL